MKMLLSLAAGMLGYCYYCGRQARLLRHQPKAVKHDVARWEDEGGNVPSVATPSPAPVPASSYPSGGASARH